MAKVINNAEQKDYVGFGTPEHATLLGLKKAAKGEELEYHGYTLVDITIYGPNATDKYLMGVLQQRVNELEHAPKVPANAPMMWTPELAKREQQQVPVSYESPDTSD